jgi:predicted DNA-binding transcriptional regulator AlpA
MRRMELNLETGHPTRLPDEGFVRLPTILAIFPIGKSSWWAGIKAGRYPRPVKLGPRVTAWRVSDNLEPRAASIILDADCGGSGHFRARPS